ncbi:hypothetical protein [Salinarchaeum laminariae]|uniref:hypothetical protein n=1 Tax=Salinarchaeum laminariae TaxID=869888 RepID=UPI0020C0EC6F|nr:hypothetical protein [Salinarchaeum laminariae]
MIRPLLKLFLLALAAYGAWVVAGDAGLVTASPPSTEEIVERLIGMLLDGAF